jgi:hypothetical protein
MEYRHSITHGWMLRSSTMRYSYGNIDASYVVAINDLSEYLHGEHAYNSLFGREMAVVTRAGNVVDQRRSTSGVFGSAVN